MHSFYDLSLLKFTNELLNIGDTGISIETRSVDYDRISEKYPEVREFVNNNRSAVIKNKVGIETSSGIIFSVYYNERTNKMEAMKIVATHPNKESGVTHFELYQESDGTQRLIDLSGGIYPAIFENRVVTVSYTHLTLPTKA